MPKQSKARCCKLASCHRAFQPWVTLRQVLTPSESRLRLIAFWELGLDFFELGVIRKRIPRLAASRPRPDGLSGTSLARPFPGGQPRGRSQLHGLRWILLIERCPPIPRNSRAHCLGASTPKPNGPARRGDPACAGRGRSCLEQTAGWPQAPQHLTEKEVSAVLLGQCFAPM